MPLPPDFIQARVDAVKSRLDVQVCSLYQADEIRESLEIMATSGLNCDVLGATLSFRQGLTGKVARSRSPVVARDIKAHPDTTMSPAPMRSVSRAIWAFPWSRRGASTGCWWCRPKRRKRFS